MGRKRKDDKYYINPAEFRDEILSCIKKYNDIVVEDADNKQKTVELISVNRNISIREAEKIYRQDIKNKCLSRKVLDMFMLLVDKTVDKMYYSKTEDKDDCRAYALKDIISYWPNYNPEKGINAFAYYSSIIFTGACKGWKAIYPDKYKGTVSINGGSGNHGQGIYTI